MKFTVSAEEINSGLAAVTRVVSTRATLPVLATVLIEANDGRVALTGSNLDLTVHRSYPAEVGAAGKCAIPAKLLAEFVGSLGGGSISFELEAKTGTLHLQSGKFDAHIKGMDAEEFPPLPEVNDGEPVEVDADAFAKVIDQVGIAASADEARPVYTGVLTSITGSILTMVATDGHRLAVAEIPTAGKSRKASESVKAIVPAKALAEVSRLLKSLVGTGANVSMTIGATKAKFEVGAFEVTSSLIDGAYPEYSKVLPTSSETILRAGTEEMRATVKVVSVFAKDSANVVKVNASPASVVISANTNEVGDNTALVEAEVTGEGVQIAFNARYVADLLKVIDSPEVEFRLNGPLSPGLALAAGDESFRYVIMPVRAA